MATFNSLVASPAGRFTQLQPAVVTSRTSTENAVLMDALNRWSIIAGILDTIWVRDIGWTASTSRQPSRGGAILGDCSYRVGAHVGECRRQSTSTTSNFKLAHGQQQTATKKIAGPRQCCIFFF